jgi:hypothetical protein
MFGIDPIVVMRDIAGVSTEERLDALEWSARMLVEVALNTRQRDAALPKSGSRSHARVPGGQGEIKLPIPYSAATCRIGSPGKRSPKRATRLGTVPGSISSP